MQVRVIPVRNISDFAVEYDFVLPYLTERLHFQSRRHPYAATAHPQLLLQSKAVFLWNQKYAPFGKMYAMLTSFYVHCQREVRRFLDILPVFLKWECAFDVPFAAEQFQSDRQYLLKMYFYYFLLKSQNFPNPLRLSVCYYFYCLYCWNSTAFLVL